MTQEQPNLKITKRGEVQVVLFEDRKILEELLIMQIGEQLGDLVMEASQPKVVLDFRNVEHLTSAALGMLITLSKQVAERQGTLVLVNIHPQIYEIFRITRLNKLFNIQSDMDAAMEQFR